MAHFAVEVFVENFLRHFRGLPMVARLDGHANCIIEWGHGKGLLIDFNYDVEPVAGKYPLPGIGAIGATLSLAVASTALAYLLYFRLLANTGAVNAALVTLLIPLSAILLGTVFLNETLEPRHLLGMAFILTGLISVDGRVLAKF